MPKEFDFEAKFLIYGLDQNLLSCKHLNNLIIINCINSGSKIEFYGSEISVDKFQLPPH